MWKKEHSQDNGDPRNLGSVGKESWLDYGETTPLSRLQAIPKEGETMRRFVEIYCFVATIYCLVVRAIRERNRYK